MRPRSLAVQPRSLLRTVCICVGWCEVRIQPNIFEYRQPHVQEPLVEKTIVSFLFWFSRSLVIVNKFMCRLFYPIVHITTLMLMPCNQDYHSLVLSFQIPSMNPPTLFFIKMVFFVLSFLYLHVNFRMSLLISSKMKMAAEIFLRDYIESFTYIY